MGDLAKKLMRKKAQKHHDEPLSPEDQRLLKKLNDEAKKSGATLHSEGRGGLPISLSTHIFRRDKFQCKNCGGKKDLTLHHKGGIPRSKWLSKKGHSNDPNNLQVVCYDCENLQHEKARADGVDSSQVTPKGDKGTDRDHGKPLAHPKS